LTEEPKVTAPEAVADGVFSAQDATGPQF
jgi:hypothetical protein